MEENTWELIQKVYKDNFGISPHMVDYVAVDEVLKQCVSGISTEKICYTLGLTPLYVMDVLYNFLGFSGWARDLDISPWRVYCRRNGIKVAFDKEIRDLTNLLDDDIIELAYRVCSIYSSIRSEMEIFYERS